LYARPYPKDAVEPQGLSSKSQGAALREKIGTHSGKASAFMLFLFEFSQPKQPDLILTIKEATAKPMNDRSV